jgi:threonine dehydrogenase-like Zn-dependent dehydrogenase
VAVGILGVSDMRAARLFGPKDLRVVDLPVPKPAADEALLRVIAYAPYGTDVSVYENRYGRYVSDYPVGIGADFSAVVEAVGADVRHLKPGDRVSACALNHCGACEKCRAGKTNLCRAPEYAVFRREACCDQYVTVPARKLARLPDEVTFDDGAMLAGVIEALNAFEKMGLSDGDSVAIVGVGAMGLGAVGTAAALGVQTVAIGGTGRRADLACRLGAKVAVRLESYNQDVTDAALAISPGGYAAVMETTISPWGLRQAFAIAAQEAVVAVTGGAELPVTSWDITERELRVVGVRAGHHQERGLELIARGQLDLKPTISARFPLERAAEAFELLSGPKARDIGRVIIDVGTA